MERDVIKSTRDRLLLLQMEAKRAFEKSLRAGEELDLEHATRLLAHISPSKSPKAPKRVLEFSVDEASANVVPELSEIDNTPSSLMGPATEGVATSDIPINDALTPAVITELVRYIYFMHAIHLHYHFLTPLDRL